MYVSAGKVGFQAELTPHDLIEVVHFQSGNLTCAKMKKVKMHALTMLCLTCFIFIDVFTNTVKTSINMKLIVDFIQFHCYN